MTLIVALGNRDQVIQVADRRLTAKGIVVDEESNKCGTIFFDDGRFNFGFTGIARALGLEVNRWILEALHDCGPPDYTAYNSLDRFCERA